MTVLALLLAGGVGGLTLTLDAPKECLPLDNVPVVLTYHANEALPAILANVKGGPVWFEVDGPTGRTVYQEEVMTDALGFQRWPSGMTAAQHVRLVHGKGGYLFPVAGQYRFRAVYRDAAADLHAESNWAHVRVEDPTEEADALVLDGLRRGGRWVELRAAYPGSRYFAYFRLSEIEMRLSRIGTNQDPESGLRADVPREELATWRKARLREVLGLLEAEANRSGSFEREALSRAQRLATSIGDEDRAAALAARLDGKYRGWRDLPDLE